MPSSFLAVSSSSRTCGIALVGLLQRRRFLDRILQLDVQRGRNHLGDAIDVGIWHVHGAAHVLDGGFCGHGAEGDDLRDVLAAVFAGHVVDDFAAAIHAEVDIDIRQGNALGIQEALEDQFVLQRIQIGDSQRVRNQRCPPPILGPDRPECRVRGRSG